MPEQAVRSLIERLEDTDENLRGAAVLALSHIGPQVVQAIPALMERVEKEPSGDVCKVLAKALAADGRDAVPALVQAVKKDNPRTLSILTEALGALGEAAVAEMANALLTDERDRVVQIAAGMFLAMGPRAAAAVPVAVRLLQEGDVIA